MPGEFNIFCVLLVPLTSILVRYRVWYQPKSDDREQDTSPPSFWRTAKTVYRILGIKGLTYGLAPSFWLMFVLRSLYPYYTPGAKLYVSASPVTMGLGIPSAILWALGYCLVIITVYRSITTTHELHAWKPRESLRLLFTPEERKKPWILYRIPGLVPALVLNVCFSIGVLRFISETYIFPWGEKYEVKEDLIRTGCNILLTILGTAFLAPLEVVTTRLATQRVPPAKGEGEDERDVEKEAVTAADEEVIPLRVSKDPYQGLVDCVQKIVEEEGWPVLYRGCFFTFAGALLG